MKRLGQHFLINQEAIEEIVSALDLKEGEAVVEVGPGHGELTKELIKHQIKLIAIEKDKRLAKELRKKIKDENLNIKIIEGDILKVLPQLKIKNYKLVGNIPYYLTGYLLRVISELKNKPNLIVFTIQKEVAERVAARKGEMNLLAASVQVWAEPEIIKILPPTYFSPPPKVKSAIIKLTPRKFLGSAQDKNYFKFIKILFKQPRKTILNNLVDGLNKDKVELASELMALNISEKDRPQDLDLKTINRLVSCLSEL